MSQPPSWNGRSREDVLADLNRPPAPRQRLNKGPLFAFLLTVAVVVGGVTSGHLGGWIVAYLVLAFVFFLFALIFKGFATEISKIFKR